MLLLAINLFSNSPAIELASKHDGKDQALVFYEEVSEERKNFINWFYRVVQH